MRRLQDAQGVVYSDKGMKGWVTFAEPSLRGEAIEPVSPRLKRSPSWQHFEIDGKLFYIVPATEVIVPATEVIVPATEVIVPATEVIVPATDARHNKSEKQVQTRY